MGVDSLCCCATMNGTGNPTAEMQALTLHRSTGSLLGVLNGPLAVGRVPAVPVPQLLLHLLPRCKQRHTRSLLYAEFA